MAVKTTLEQLEEVQAAISDIETGIQEATIGDLRYAKARLNHLYSREKSLRVRYYREQKNKGRIRINMSGGV